MWGAWLSGNLDLQGTGAPQAGNRDTQLPGQQPFPTEEVCELLAAWLSFCKSELEGGREGRPWGWIRKNNHKTTTKPPGKPAEGRGGAGAQDNTPRLHLHLFPAAQGILALWTGAKSTAARTEQVPGASPGPPNQRTVHLFTVIFMG